MCCVVEVSHFILKDVFVRKGCCQVMGFFGWVGTYSAISEKRAGLETARSGTAEP